MTRLTFQIYKDGNQQWRWRLHTGTGRTIANAGEGYHTKTDCLTAVELVRASAKAKIEDVTPVLAPSGRDVTN